MMKRKLMMMKTTSMKKSSLKSVSRELYVGVCGINDSSFNMLNDVNGGWNLVYQYWDMFYEPINSNLVGSRILLSTLDL
jgi:hypothetical protein